MASFNVDAAEKRLKAQLADNPELAEEFVTLCENYEVLKDLLQECSAHPSVFAVSEALFKLSPNHTGTLSLPEFRALRHSIKHAIGTDDFFKLSPVRLTETQELQAIDLATNLVESFQSPLSDVQSKLVEDADLASLEVSASAIVKAHELQPSMTNFACVLPDEKNGKRMMEMVYKLALQSELPVSTRCYTQHTTDRSMTTPVPTKNLVPTLNFSAILPDAVEKFVDNSTQPLDASLVANLRRAELKLEPEKLQLLNTNSDVFMQVATTPSLHQKNLQALAKTFKPEASSVLDAGLKIIEKLQKLKERLATATDLPLRNDKKSSRRNR